ncbi:hypothetical protein INS49_010042 [Diaporthe citri]|uniref:uncharacterized protein n=1 Tax=Diaporthe citri TaxID=83186 RepID=UPI001C821709|nr:uncharacterized protein INS49_010042 [Diaporthe citri]KAG6361813.1 hypothetical protein INS49_010042 [Diaporthe citri]
MPTVYDGTRGSSHGDLFMGMKLFISLRVPQRERWVNLVQGNGGEVVKLEKQADMLIADHIKRKGVAPPSDSYSWQWIEYSVKNGFLQPKDDYRIEGVPAAGASAPAKGKQRVKFTKEDDEILAKFVLNHERQGNATRGNVIFEDLYKQYDHHSAQSWRDRWVKYVSNRPRPNLPQEDPQLDAGVRGSPGHHPSSALMRGYLLRMRKAEGLLDSLEANSEPLEAGQDEYAEQYEDAQEELNPEVDGNDSSFRDQFYEDLQDYLEVSGAEIERHPVVDGREVELWDLFSVATQQDCAVEDRDWKKVAQRLGFDWTSSTGCVKDLKECYDRNLAEFEEAIGSSDDQDDTARGEEEQATYDNEEQGLPQTSDAMTAPKEPSPARLSPPYRSSSPVAGVKRSFQQSTDPQSELGYPSDGSGKRRRRDRGKAIPQTPDHKLGLEAGTSSRAAAQGFSSPLRSRGAATGRDGVYSVDDVDDFLNNGMHDIQEIDDLPDIPPPRKKRFVEPETQDFGAVVDGDDVRLSTEETNTGYMTDEDDISPSQQLQSEFHAFSSPAHPVPIRGNGTASASRPPFVETRPRPPGRPAKDTHTSASGTATTNGSAKGGTAHNRASTLKATKRSLPQQYQAQPAVSAAARPPASAPIRNGVAAPPLQSRPPIVARPTAVAPVHSPDVVMQRSRQRMSATPTRPVQSSAQPRNFPDFGEEYVDAQFEHFLAFGYDTRHIGQAMEVASLQRGPMTVALQSLAAGKGLPQNAAGVWTDEDDDKLRKVRAYDRRQKSGAPSSGSGENSGEKAQVERYRSFLLTKHQSWFAYRLAFMNLMDKETAA